MLWGIMPLLMSCVRTDDNGRYDGDDTSSDKPAGALRCLFALSESSSSSSSNANNIVGMPSHTTNARIDMVKSSSLSSSLSSDQRLIPALLSFLRRCPRDSSEQYLSLLVLNNLFIPRENKRIIALDCGGARVLGRMLCEDPGCHLLAIVLVNLTFGDEALNRDLMIIGGRNTGGGGTRSSWIAWGMPCW